MEQNIRLTSMALTKVGVFSTSGVVLGVVTGVLLKLSLGVHL